jgi:glutamyl endopeptidase
MPTGSIGTQSLYVDSRYPVANPAAYPNSTMVLLTLQNGTGSYRCSGFLINANTVATAGHCLHFNGAWSYNVRAYPGYTGSYAPYSSCSATRLFSVNGWVSSKDSQYDYGAVKLNCTIGNSTGWLGFRWPSANLDGLSVHIQGYPADKGWDQWGHDGSVSRTYALNTYSSPTSGFDGAPVFDNGRYAVAIFSTTASLSSSHCNGDICSVTSESYSRGTRITQEVYNNLLYWRSL